MDSFKSPNNLSPTTGNNTHESSDGKETAPEDKQCSQTAAANDVRCYLRAKREELDAIIRYKATVKFQATWRTFLARARWNALESAASKIQTVIKAYQLRRKWRVLVKEAVAKHLQEAGVRENSATKIQSMWRGYISRKTHCMKNRREQRNEALRQAIEKINQLKTASRHDDLTIDSVNTEFSEQSLMSSLSRNCSKEDVQDSLEVGVKADVNSVSPFLSLTNLINENPDTLEILLNKFIELIKEVEDKRIASELHTSLDYLEHAMKTEEKLGRLHKTLSGKQRKILRESRRRQKQLANHILDLVNRFDSSEHKEDDVDAMFPSVPDRPDVIQPDRKKVEALKDAIRLAHQQAKVLEERQLKRKHVLLRTKSRPGVYSDIYTTELTDWEQKVKSLKFWNHQNVFAKTVARREEAARKKRLKQLFAHALKIFALQKDLNRAATPIEEVVVKVEDNLDGEGGGANLEKKGMDEVTTIVDVNEEFREENQEMDEVTTIADVNEEFREENQEIVEPVKADIVEVVAGSDDNEVDGAVDKENNDIDTDRQPIFEDPPTPPPSIIVSIPEEFMNFELEETEWQN